MQIGCVYIYICFYNVFLLILFYRSYSTDILEPGKTSNNEQIAQYLYSLLTQLIKSIIDVL